MNVEDLIKSKNLYFKDAGGQDYLIKCLNPDHPDNNPSLRVNKTTGAMHCFSCDFKGNLFSHYEVAADYTNIFLMRAETLLSSLLRKGVQIPELSVPVNRPYRGVPAKILEKYEAFTNDEFPDRIVFPVRDLGGELQGMIGRHLDANTTADKYMIYPRGAQLPVFPANPDIVDGQLVLVEGLFDVFALNMHEVTNVSACLGTSTMLRQWREKLLPLKELKGARILTIVFDGDVAGKTSARKLKEAVEGEFSVRILTLPKDKDVAELNPSELQELLRKINGKS